MSDHELLEMAAKACGYWDKQYQVPDKLPVPDWNPLKDDAQAFWLAVKLKIDIVPVDPDGFSHAYTTNTSECPAFRASERRSSMHFASELAATRRAIVRAAAAIGEQMP